MVEGPHTVKGQRLARFADRVRRPVETLSEFAGRLGQFLIVLVVIVGFGNVVLRYAGQYTERKLTSNAWIEAQWYLYGTAFLLGFPHVLKHNVNVRVDFWYGRFSAAKKAVIDLVGHLLALLPFCILALTKTWGPVMTSFGRRPDGSWPAGRVWDNWEQSPDPDGFPRAPIKAMIVVGFALLLLQAVVEVLKLVTTITGADANSSVAPDEPRRVE